VTIPRQKFGLNKFSTSISVCPTNPDAINVIAFQNNNLVAINGAVTSISIPLDDFFIPVNSASMTNIVVPAKVDNIPYKLVKVDLGSIYTSSNITCACNNAGSTAASGNSIGLLPKYPSDTLDGETYLEWATIESIEEGELYTSDPVGPTGTTTSFDILNINKIEFASDANISWTGGTGPMWIGTDGGLLKWNNTDMILRNTLNSTIPSDFVNSIDVNTNMKIWLATDEGISLFTENAEIEFETYNISNSDILSNKVYDIKRLSDTKVAIATDSGLSIFDKLLNTWESYTKYNTPSLTYNVITKLSINSTTIYMATTGGVFSYDTETSTWDSFTSTGTTGWTGPDEVLSLATTGTDLYVGTTGGLVVIPFSGATASVIVSGVTGPVSNTFSSLRIIDNTLYAGHDDGISIYNITNAEWTYGVTSSLYSSLGLTSTDIIPDYNSGLTSGETIFFGNSQGINKWLTTGATFSPVPESNKVTNLLLYYPNASVIDTNIGYSSLQNIYLIFSKPIDIDSVGTYTDLTVGGTSVSGVWTWSNNNTVAEFDPTEELSKATLYNLSILNGTTASDGSYLKESISINFYTEEIVPILGWETMGKILMLSGTETHPIEGIYLRNPHDFDVHITSLIGN